MHERVWHALCLTGQGLVIIVWPFQTDIGFPMQSNALGANLILWGERKKEESEKYQKKEPGYGPWRIITIKSVYRLCVRVCIPVYLFKCQT